MRSGAGRSERGGPLAMTVAAAREVLCRNAMANRRCGLPRTAAFGYPEPYTRDLMISSLAMFAMEDGFFEAAIGRVLESLADNQSPLGHIPSLADEPHDRGESDTTPLFLIGLAAHRRKTGSRARTLDSTARKALSWLEHQSPGDRVIVAQQPTSDWRDEQWVLGYGLYVNTLVYAALRLFGRHARARALRAELNRPVAVDGCMGRRQREGLVLPGLPYYALWSFKVLGDRRFDLLGNSLAILTGVASRARARAIIKWVEDQCARMRAEGTLAGAMPPVLFPFVLPGEPDWRPRYERFNRPGHYHNGGIWPFVCGLYVAAMIAAGMRRLAGEKLEELARLVAVAADPRLGHGFNEWMRAGDGAPLGQDWQTWSAAMFLYAEECVRRGSTPLFDEIREAGR